MKKDRFAVPYTPEPPVGTQGPGTNGLPRSEIIEKTAHDLLSKQTAELIERHDKQLLMENCEIDAGTHTIETPGNGVRIVSVKRLPIAGKDGDSHFLLSMIEDHTHLNSSAA